MSEPAPANEPRPTASADSWAAASAVCSVGGLFVFGVPGLFGMLFGLSALLAGCRRKFAASVGVVFGIAALALWTAAGWWLWGQLKTKVEPEPPARPVGRIDPEAQFDPVHDAALLANVRLVAERVGPVRTESWLGSGVVLEVAGGSARIVTNRHVVEPEFETPGAAPPTRLTVQFLNGRTVDARVAWLAPHGIDLALVTCPATAADAKPARLDLRRVPKLMEPVFAVGNPEDFGWSFSAGSVSMLREWKLGERWVKVIQTDAGIQSGNSGGGLYAADGTLLGVITWTADRRGAQGLSFALSIQVLADLFRRGAPELLPLLGG